MEIRSRRERGIVRPSCFPFFREFCYLSPFQTGFQPLLPAHSSPSSLASCHSSSFQLFSAVSICIFCEATATATGHYISDLDESKMERKRLPSSSSLSLFLLPLSLFNFTRRIPTFFKEFKLARHVNCHTTRVCIALTRRYSLTHASPLRL